MRKFTLAVAATAMSVPAAMTLPAAPAGAVTYDHNGGYHGRTWRGRDGRYYCRRPDGTTGLIVGGVAGGVLGNLIAPGGSKTLGTLVGAGAGALIGREIDRSKVRCR